MEVKKNCMRCNHNNNVKSYVGARKRIIGRTFKQMCSQGAPSAQPLLQSKGRECEHEGALRHTQTKYKIPLCNC